MTVRPNNLQTVIMKNAGHVVPVDLLRLIIAQKPNVFGFAVQGQTDDGSPELSIGREEGTPEMHDLEEFQRNAMDFRAMLSFGWLKEGFNTEDILPFVINDADDKPFIAIGMEGDFPKYDNNEGRTQEFNLAQDIILPTLADICELVDGDITKLVAALGKPSFNNTFLSQIGHRGVLNILPFEGEPVMLAKNELGGDSFDWGQTSQLHGFGDAVQEPVKAEAPKKKFSFGGKKAATPPELPKDVATKGEGPKTSVPEVRKTGNTTIVDVKKEEPKTAGPLPVRPPEWCHKNDDKRSWYQMLTGALPKGWKHNIPVIPVDGVTPPAKIEDLDAWRADRKKAVISNHSVEPAKTATAAGAPKTGKEVAAIKAEENLPIIGAKNMEKILDVVTKYIDGQSVQVIKPSEIQSVEKKFLEFSAAVASTPQETVNWPVSMLFAIGQTDLGALVSYAVEHRAGNRLRMEKEGLMKTEAPKATTTVTKSGDNTTKTESISNEAPPATKKKLFSFGKKAA